MIRDGAITSEDKILGETFDVVVVGGNFAGVSAALPLARARRRVLVVDAGKPRNRFSHGAHNFYGHDGKPPLEAMAEAQRQFMLYPTATFFKGEAVSASGQKDVFSIVLANGLGVTARRLVLATGVKDTLPDLPGLTERWGQSVVHCPYCHGYELPQGPLGVLGVGAHSLHSAVLATDWGPIIFFTQGKVEPDGEAAALFAARGVTVERSPVVELLGPAPALEAVRLADGRVVALGGLFVAPQVSPASPLAQQLGCAFDEAPMGPYLRVNEMKETSVPGVFAAGDIAQAMHSAPLAAAAGMMAGVCAHRSLIWE
jgi:thioredoxin reductase